MDKNIDYNIYSAMQTEKPYSKFRKTILGKVFVWVWNDFNDTPESLHLIGRPAVDNDESIVMIYSQKGDVFFKKQNAKHFKSGTLIPMKLEEAPKKSDEKGYDEYSDKDIEEIVNSRFLALKNVLAKATSEAFVLRILTAAEESEKSEKVLNHIRNRLSEIQSPVQEDVN